MANLNRSSILAGKPGDSHLDSVGLPDEQRQNRIIAEIVELQREYYYENKNKESERRRRLRDVIDRATPLTGA